MDMMMMTDLMTNANAAAAVKYQIKNSSLAVTGLLHVYRVTMKEGTCGNGITLYASGKC